LSSFAYICLQKIDLVFNLLSKVLTHTLVTVFTLLYIPVYFSNLILYIMLVLHWLQLIYIRISNLYLMTTLLFCTSITFLTPWRFLYKLMLDTNYTNCECVKNIYVVIVFVIFWICLPTIICTYVYIYNNFVFIYNFCWQICYELL